ncbi:DNA polymerase zeta catalytic subunit, partial [Ananas comosus]
VKSYLQRQWTRILSGKVSLQDFIFAKEVRLGTYSSRASSLPPSAIVATKAMAIDPRAEPHMPALRRGRLDSREWGEVHVPRMCGVLREAKGSERVASPLRICDRCRILPSCESELF